MLRSVFLLLLSPLTAALQPRDFRVPPVDFTQLSSAANNAHNSDLLAKLQQDGIVALQNVPNYANLRKEYLRTAVNCAVQAQHKGSEFLLHRQLRDGTNRYTVSLESGRQMSQTLQQSQELLTTCPEYVQIHAAFSAAVELAVASVGSAMDATHKFQVMAEQGAVAMTARQLMDESVHLDHFHAYEAPAGRRLENDVEINVNDMSLELHTDNGLLIAMSAPEYFQVSNSGEVIHEETQGHDAGLFIQTADGKIVRPVLEADELILMLGSGIDDWIKTTPPLHAVLHGMRYPRAVSVVGGDEQGNKLLRSWFGKMILLDEHQVMDNTGMTFGQYANQTTRYLVQQDAEGHDTFGAVACPPQRHLAASDNSCSLKICSLKSSAKESDLTYSCQITCNHDSTSDAALCTKYCDCKDSTSSATTCWMLCVENFSSDVCPGEQECNNASTEDTLAMTCVAGTASPSASTSAPSTTAPSTTTPSTTSPSTTPSTATSTPNTTAPSATAPSSTAGTLTLSPVTTAPASTEPPASAAPPTTGSNSMSSAAENAGSVSSTTNVGDVSTAASAADGSSSTITAPSTADETSSASTSASASSATSSSSAASVIPVAIFVNGVAVLVAAFLCIQ